MPLRITLSTIQIPSNLRHSGGSCFTMLPGRAGLHVVLERIQGFRFRVLGSGSRFRFQGFGVRVPRFGFQVWGYPLALFRAGLGVVGVHVRLDLLPRRVTPLLQSYLASADCLRVGPCLWV
jgi:hypothetical protein